MGEDGDVHARSMAYQPLSRKQPGKFHQNVTSLSPLNCYLINMRKDDSPPNPSRRRLLRAAGAVALNVSPVISWVTSTIGTTPIASNPFPTTLPEGPKAAEALMWFIEELFDVRDRHEEASVLGMLLKEGRIEQCLDDILEYEPDSLLNRIHHFLQSDWIDMAEQHPSLETIRNGLRAIADQDRTLHAVLLHDDKVLEQAAREIYDMSCRSDQQIAEDIAALQKQCEPVVTDLNRRIKQALGQPETSEQSNGSTAVQSAVFPIFGTRYRDKALSISTDYYKGQPANSWHERLTEQAQEAGAMQEKSR